MKYNMEGRMTEKSGQKLLMRFQCLGIESHQIKYSHYSTIIGFSIHFTHSTEWRPCMALLRPISNSRKAHYIPDCVIQRTSSLQGLSEQTLILPIKRKVRQLEHKKALTEASALKQNMARVTKKDNNEALGRLHNYREKVHLFKVWFHKCLEKVISGNCKLNLLHSGM